MSCFATSQEIVDMSTKSSLQCVILEARKLNLSYNINALDRICKTQHTSLMGKGSKRKNTMNLMGQFVPRVH
jgi:hypothetical protein